MSLYNELKRRNVFRVGIAYLAGAWLLTEVAGTLFPAFGVPDWGVRFVVIVLALGFAPALIISWAYELTPEGLKREQDVVRDESITHLTAKRLDGITIGLIVAALVILMADRFWLSPRYAEEHAAAPTEVVTKPQYPPNSIAVLAFVNMSDDASNEYFSDGISEELLNVLARVPGLRVISRSSAFSFKGKDMKIADVARELNVALILEGSVRKAGNRVRITAQLIEAETDAHLWSDSYDRELSDIFAIQEEIAQSITTAMRGVLGVRIVKVDRPTGDLEAYQAFLLGRQLFYQRGPALDDAIAALQSAVERDPAFVEAWAFLAAAASVTWGYDTAISDENAIVIAEEASQRALELDPNMGLAIAVQAKLFENVYRDLNKALDLFHRAINIDPGNSTIRVWVGQFKFHFGYLSEALRDLERAYELDPQVGIIDGVLGMIYLASGRDVLARPRLAKAEELGWSHHFPTWAAHLMLSGAYELAVAYLDVGLNYYDADNKDPVVLRTRYLLTEAGRNRDPVSLNALVEYLDANPIPGNSELYLFLAFDLRDRFFKRLSRRVAESTRWRYMMRSVWLPGYRAYIEDLRFFEIMREAGAVTLWEQRGYPDGCVRVSDPAGDRLDCTKRYR